MIEAQATSKPAAALRQVSESAVAWMPKPSTGPMRIDVSKYKCRYELPGSPDDVYIIPVSGGADSTALAVLMVSMFPDVPFKFIFTDTGAEDDELMDGLDRLEAFLGITIERIHGDKTLWSAIDGYNGYLPGVSARWCTRELKLVPYAAWMEQFGDRTKQMFVGIRADENTRIAFTLDQAETQMPFVDIGLSRSDVYEILQQSVGIPRMYAYRSRSGCSTCPFMQRNELVGLLQYKPKEFAKGMAYEKIGPKIPGIQDPAVPLWKDSGLALNHLSIPEPTTDIAKGRARNHKQDDMFGNRGIFVAAEFFYESYCGINPFLWHKRVVTYSPSLAGIKKQITGRYHHLLNVPEVFEMRPEDVRNQVRFAIYYIELPSSVFDPSGPTEGYTWQQGESMRQIEHIISWATRSLHAEYLRSEAEVDLDKLHPLSYQYESTVYSKKAMDRLQWEVGNVASSGWYQPPEPSEDDEIEYEKFACPVCSL